MRNKPFTISFNEKENSIKRVVKQSLLVGGTMLSIGVAGAGTMGLANAATNTTSDTSNPQSSIVEKLASKFKLNKEDVQKVFDEERTERKAANEAKVKEKLDALVKEGKLTQDQADKLIAKAAELKTTRQANRDAMQNKTAAERKAAMQAERAALDKWLSDNGIAKEYGRFLTGGGHGGRGGHGLFRGPGQRGEQPTESQGSDS